MFEVEGKSDGWHTAFYYLAEHVRSLTDGSVNHKELYALVGIDGRYLNHANPIVRKRTAGALSRIVHSSRYVKDMQARYRQESNAFRAASSAVYDAVEACGVHDANGFVGYLQRECWPDVRCGFCNEKAEWRNDLDLFRVDQEVRMLFRSAAASGNDRLGAGQGLAVEVFAALLHIVAFGRAERDFSRMLVDEYPTETLVESHALVNEDCDACIVRFSDASHSSIVGSWPVACDRPFIIGRYADCDVVVAEPNLSRIHCCVYRKGGVWYFEDMNSSNGSCVTRGGSVVFDSAHDGASVPFALEQGDAITLSSCCHLWFGSHLAPGHPFSP